MRSISRYDCSLSARRDRLRLDHADAVELAAAAEHLEEARELDARRDHVAAGTTPVRKRGSLTISTTSSTARRAHA